jgi:cysteine desulfurase
MMRRAPIYLDYAATTPVDPAVAQAMSACLGFDGDFGNSAAITHSFGRRAASRVETARMQVAALLMAEPDEIVFTSGATESNNLALLGVARANADRGRHLVTSRIEHKAVLDPCRRLEKEGFVVTYLEPDQSGLIDPGVVRAALRADTLLVSIMLANNEIGVLQNVAAIGAVCRERDILFHTDASQAVGKVPVDVRMLSVDLLSCTAHKFYGPKGSGALYVRRAARAKLRPVSYGGGQERGLRPGTLATHQIVGLGAACELAGNLLAAEGGKLAMLRDRLWLRIAPLGGVFLNGASAPRLPAILNVSFTGVEGESLVSGLSELAVSTGSACNSASLEPSFVLRALGRDSQLAQSSIRFSLGRYTSEQDIDSAADFVIREVRRLRAVVPDFEASGRVGAIRGAEAAAQGEMSPAAATNPVAGLSALASQYFLTLPRAGEFRIAEADSVLTGEAGSRSQGTWVRFHLFIRGRIVKDARFQTYGCPHTLAVAAWLTHRLVGTDLKAPRTGAPADWAREMGVPVEKLGRLLVVEDALQACFRHGSGTGVD